MSEKRKDNKGRILKTGESQRNDGLYMFRYTDIHGKRRYTYGATLEELRQKEDVIQRDLHDGIDYAAGEVTVSELIDRYMNLKRGLSHNSQRAYSPCINRIKAAAFGERQVKSVKLSDAKGYLVALHDEGLKQNTIQIFVNILRPAFEMAVDDDMIRKNPFKFRLSDIVPKDATVRDALTKSQQARYLAFIDKHGTDNYYDDIVVLLGTGLRVSELYGLTKSDINFKANCIHVRRQLCRTAEKPYFITTPKTSSGIRNIPMTDTVCETLQKVIQNRKHPNVEMIVEGHGGFLFLDKDGKPKVAMHLENYMRMMQKRYVELNGNNLPRVTPHVLRHTFCTNAQQAGLDVKSLQYVMGHSNVSTTLDIYTHSSFDLAQKAFEQIASSL